MDPITHALVGGLAAKSVQTSKRRFWVMGLLGMAPDLDVFANYLGGWAALLQHRGVTHSLFGWIVQTLFFAWLFARWDRGRYYERAFHYSLAIGLHLVCDFLTSYGIPWLSPFYFSEVSADLMPGFTAIPLFFMAVGIFYLHRRGHEGWRATRPLWILWSFNLLFAVSTRSYAQRMVPMPGHQATMVPTTINPFVWRTVEVDPAARMYREKTINLLNGKRGNGVEVPFPAKNFPINASLRSQLVTSFLRDNRWPVARSIKQENGWIVEWGRLVFSVKGDVRGKVRVRVSDDGQILDERPIFNFWSAPAAVQPS